MCIIIYKTKYTKLKKETLKTAFENNPDGAGFMYQSDALEVPKMKKGFFDFNEFYDAYKLIADQQRYNIAIHFRIATHGAVNSLNCHPFIVTNKVEDTISESGVYDSLFMQNGVIKSISVNRKDKYSDTCNFTYKIMSNLKTLASTKIKDVVEAIEPASKFCLMQKGRTPLLIGNFTKENGICFSNESYKTVKTLSNYSYVEDSYLLEFKGLTTDEIKEVQEELNKHMCICKDFYDVSDFTFFEVTYLPLTRTLAGKTFKCYR